MKKLILKSSTLLLGAVLIFSSCKKNKDTEPDDTSNAVHAGDEAKFQTESDQISDDASDALSGSVSLSGARLSSLNSLCNVQVDSIGQGEIKLTFKGTTCDGKRTRSGYATVQLQGGKWKDAGSIAIITLDSVKITRIRDGKSIMLSGTHSITNVSGGLFKHLQDGTQTTPLVHEINTSVSITFDDQTTKQWASHRRRTFTKTGSDYNIEVQGLGTDGGYSNVVTSGTTRNGATFYTVITTAVNLNSCSSNGIFNWTVIQGVKDHYINGKDVTVTYGVDQSGYAVNTCAAYGYKVAWTNAKGKMMEIIGQY
jgi:hypothetical protein